MQYEYDPKKSATNKVKHGIDFEEAKALLDDENLIVIDSAYKDEPRSLAIGRINGIYWTAVITFRQEAIRFISCRRAHKNEEALYVQRHRH